METKKKKYQKLLNYLFILYYCTRNVLLWTWYPCHVFRHHVIIIWSTSTMKMINMMNHDMIIIQHHVKCQSTIWGILADVEVIFFTQVLLLLLISLFRRNISRNQTHDVSWQTGLFSFLEFTACVQRHTLHPTQGTQTDVHRRISTYYSLLFYLNVFVRPSK